MRQDQFERLLILSEKITEVVLEEADPDGWPGKGIALANLDASSRGDRYWCKKNAAASLGLLLKLQSLAHIRRKIGISDPDETGSTADDDGDIDKEIAATEKEANKLLAKIQSKAYGRTA